MAALDIFAIAFMLFVAALIVGSALIIAGDCDDMQEEAYRLYIEAQTKETSEEREMTQERFFALAQKTVADYTNAHLDKTDWHTITPDEVYIVWSCKVLQNWKALLSTPLPDGMYYELTLNGDKAELYLDAYKKFENRCISITEG